MVAIVRMGVIMYPAIAIVEDMPQHYQHHGRKQQEQVVLQKNLFEHQKNNPQCKQNKGQPAMVVAFVAMPERITANNKGQGNHAHFKSHIFYNINTKKRQTGQEKRQYRAVDSARHRGGNTQGIPVDPKFHCFFNIGFQIRKTSVYLFCFA